MKFSIILAAALTLATSVQANGPSKKVIKSIDETLDFALEQTQVLYSHLEENKKLHPRTVMEGKLVTANDSWWTSGFFPGTMWYLYEYSNDAKALAIAKEMTQRTLGRQHVTNNHDIGFQINCSAGNGYRLTKNPEYREAIITASGSLAKRFKPTVGCTRSWDTKGWSYPVIIDNMMNMELFCVGSAMSGDEQYRDMAIAHSETTWKSLYRPDNSCFHLVDFDPQTGEVLKQQTHQGYSDSSAWSRGQAWGLYGYTMMYRCTGKQEFLDHAIAIANFMIDHPNMPKDLIPYWDYDAPNIPEASRDASAAAVMASGLLELSLYVEPSLSKKFYKVAETQVLNMSKAPYRSQNVGDNFGFILTNSVGFMRKQYEVDAPLTYADYYFVEAMLRLKKMYAKDEIVVDYNGVFK